MDYWVVIVSYAIGAFPSAYLAGRFLKGVDIRKIGDKNAGAANVFRNISHVAGIAVLVTDIGKGALAIFLSSTVDSQFIKFFCGIAVLAGHNWPIFLRFKGGRGLAPTIGVLLALIPVPATILSVAGILALWKTGNLVITGVIMFAPLPLLAWLFKVPANVILYALALLCFTGVMHVITTRRLTQAQKEEAIHWR